MSEETTVEVSRGSVALEGGPSRGSVVGSPEEATAEDARAKRKAPGLKDAAVAYLELLDGESGASTTQLQTALADLANAAGYEPETLPPADHGKDNLPPSRLDRTKK